MRGNLSAVSIKMKKLERKKVETTENNNKFKKNKDFVGVEG